MLSVAPICATRIEVGASTADVIRQLVTAPCAIEPVVCRLEPVAFPCGVYHISDSCPARYPAPVLGLPLFVSGLLQW
jgi:hypothetical protein